MMSRLVSIFALIGMSVAFAGCSGGSSTLPLAPTASPTPAASPSPSPTATPASSYVFTSTAASSTSTSIIEEFGPTGTTPLSTFPAPTVVTGAASVPVDFVGDAAGNIYVAYAATAVQEFAAAPPHPVMRTITGFTAPTALAVDLHGNLFVADGAGSGISEFAPGSTTPSRTLGFTDVFSLATDTSGNLYAGEVNDVLVFAPGASAPMVSIPIPMQSGVQPVAVYAIAIDAENNLDVFQRTLATVCCSQGYGEIYSYAPGATAPSTSTGFYRPTGPQSLFLDPRGNLFVSGTNGSSNGEVAEFPAGSTTATIIGGPEQLYVYQPTAVSADAEGDVYYVDGGSIREFAPGGTAPLRTLPAQAALYVSARP